VLPHGFDFTNVKSKELTAFFKQPLAETGYAWEKLPVAVEKKEDCLYYLLYTYFMIQ